MKARLTTVLLLTGVLVAGSAAAMVNTEVLRPSAATTTVNLPVESIHRSEATDTTVLAAPPAASQATYRVGESGSVTLDTHAEVLSLVAVSPAEGWTVVSAANTDATTIEVVLQAGTVQTTFRAALLYGVVNTSVATVDSAATPTTTRRHRSSSSAGTSTPSNDDHSDESPEPPEDSEQDD